jgi:hypothetical protein
MQIPRTAPDRVGMPLPSPASVTLGRACAAPLLARRRGVWRQPVAGLRRRHDPNWGLQCKIPDFTFYKRTSNSDRDY